MPSGSGRSARGDVYDWWSRHPRALDVLYAMAFLGREQRLRDASLDALDVESGERILELGAGHGDTAGAIAQAVGEHGTVVALDASDGMVRSARSAVIEHGLETVHVVRGDAQRPPIEDDTVDAAYAAMSLSAMESPADAIAAVADALRAGGRFVVLDAQPFDRIPWCVINPIVRPLATLATDWQPSVDIVAELRKRFDSVSVETYHGGSIVLARAQSAPID